MRKRRKNGTPGMSLQEIADGLNSENVPTNRLLKNYFNQAVFPL
jgi:hypothetical protein